MSGVTVSGSEAEGYVFTIYNADGTKQEVELPSAASLITSIDVAKSNSAKGSTFVITKAVFHKPENGLEKLRCPKIWLLFSPHLN